MTSNEIRSQFLKFFESKAHHIVPSAPMVIKNDPTLMFTNAGMNQFKDIFLGNADAPYPRACDAQKCLRVSGKHNDLEEVGHDTYHHTMFEMLGNWSFGDYFKREAIAYGWEFLTEVMHIDKRNLYVTVFGGDAKDGLEMDTEAYNFWKEHIDESRILKGSKKDNFWEMGEQGPCGPCSEIHIDLRDEAEKKLVPGHELVNKDNPLVIEIWNLVFMQYNRLANGTLEPLKAKHIDTGMGFERLCMVMQGKKSNYDTDVFQPLIQHIARLAGRTYGQENQADIAMRVIADHLRAVSFSIADGQLPGNAKAGYVIRRILRRAVRYGYTFLGFKEPFMNTLVDTLVNQMGGQYPELVKQQQLIQRIILEEEQSFLKTLAGGIKRFDDYIASHATGNNKTIDGAFAFELFDTYGFPVDLTQLMAAEQGWTVDMEGFQQGLTEQKNRSRAAATVENDDWMELMPNVNQYNDDEDFENSRFKDAFESIFEVDGTVEYAFVKDVVMRVDSLYRTIPDRKHRAIAGLSIGGYQSIYFGANHPDVFGFIGAFSPYMWSIGKATPYRREFYGKLHERMGLQYGNLPPEGYYLYAGKWDIMRPSTLKLHYYMTRKGYRHEYTRFPGSHDWKNGWIEEYQDMLQRVFKPQDRQ